MKKLLILAVLIAFYSAPAFAVKAGDLVIYGTTTVKQSLEVDPGAYIDMGGNKVENVANPTATGDAINLFYGNTNYADRSDVDTSTAALQGQIDTNKSSITDLGVSTGTNAANITTNANDIYDLQVTTGAFQIEIDGKLSLDGTDTMTGDLNMGYKGIVSVTTMTFTDGTYLTSTSTLSGFQYYSTTFTSGDAGVAPDRRVTITHSLGRQYLAVTVADENDELVLVTIDYTDTNNFDIVLGNGLYSSMTGTWKVEAK